MNNFQLIECFVINGLRITEYVTRFNVRRFDIQPWKGEREFRLPFENEDGTWEVKTFPIEIYARPSGLMGVE